VIGDFTGASLRDATLVCVRVTKHNRLLLRSQDPSMSEELHEDIAMFTRKTTDCGGNFFTIDETKLITKYNHSIT
jgi:hypothetical protein